MGKLIIEDEDSGPSAAVGAGDVGDAMAGSAFMSAQRGLDGQTRDAKGNLRFNKNTKRSREEERMLDLDEEDGKKVVERRKKRMEMGKLGGEFKAKVSYSERLHSETEELNMQRAGGDIKRTGGPDPYSYVPIGQAARGGSKGGRVNLTNKKKGSRR